VNFLNLGGWLSDGGDPPGFPVFLFLRGSRVLFRPIEQSQRKKKGEKIGEKEKAPAEFRKKQVVGRKRGAQSQGAKDTQRTKEADDFNCFLQAIGKGQKKNEGTPKSISRARQLMTTKRKMVPYRKNKRGNQLAVKKGLPKQTNVGRGSVYCIRRRTKGKTRI